LQKLPEVARKEATRPVPFHFETEDRGELYQAEFEKQKYFDELNDKLSKQFHAQPLPANVPFVPAKSTKAPTEPEPMFLTTENRLAQRKVFDEFMRQKMQEQEELKRMLEKEREVKLVLKFKFH
jgi:hypothetical protein